jgi:hypothetical protein
MRKKFTAAAILCLTAAAILATVAAARPISTKQRVSIMEKNSSFALTPASSGLIKRDSGTFAACCWTKRHVVRSGQRLELDDPLLTLTGKNGTLKLRNHIVWVDLPDGWSIFTGMWKVVGGTGAYAGLSGHGTVAAAQSPSGQDRTQFFGFLGK